MTNKCNVVFLGWILEQIRTLMEKKLGNLNKGWV